VAWAAWAGCALVQAGGQARTHWGAFGAVNPGDGAVADSRGVGEEERPWCLQPWQLCAV